MTKEECDKLKALDKACNLAINPDNVVSPDSGARCISVDFSNHSKCIDVSFSDYNNGCISVTPRCKPLDCDDEICDVQNPIIELYDLNGNDISEDRVVYFGATYKVHVVNHTEMVEAGYNYDYRVYASGAELDEDGWITWTEPEGNIGTNITLQSRQLYFSFYKDNKCYSTLTYTIYPKLGNVIEWWDLDDVKHVITNTNSNAFVSTFNGRTDVKKVHIAHMMDNVTSMMYFMSYCDNCETFTCSADTSSVSYIYAAWQVCSSLTSFSYIDTSNVTDMTAAWLYCSSLTSFPYIDTSNVGSMDETWAYCSSLTSFPYIDTSNVGSMDYTWLQCSSLRDFGGVSDCSAATHDTWYGTPLNPKPCGT